MIVGELATAEDAAAGSPFSGQAGALLDKVLRSAGLSRDECLLANYVRCPGAPPKKAEVDACKAWLWAEIRTLRPLAVASMGRGPTSLLLRLKAGATLEGLVNTAHRPDYMGPGGIVVPMYSPAYLLSHGMKQVEAATLAFVKIRNHIRGVHEGRQEEGVGRSTPG